MRAASAAACCEALACKSAIRTLPRSSQATGMTFKPAIEALAGLVP